MTPDQFAAAVTDRLRRRGASYQQDDLDAFMALAWLQLQWRPDPDVWAERFLAEQERRGHLRAIQVRGAAWRWVTWAAGGIAAAIVLAVAGVSLFLRQPASALAVAAVVLIVIVLTLSRLPIDSQVLRWVVLIAATTVLSVTALVILLASRCHVP